MAKGGEEDALPTGALQKKIPRCYLWRAGLGAREEPVREFSSISKGKNGSIQGTVLGIWGGDSVREAGRRGDRKATWLRREVDVRGQ